jgi:hypothetical protein
MSEPTPTSLPGRERTVVLLAIGAVALHVVDDNFLQPEPGTGAGDHLASGLVPLLLLAGAAAGYPLLRPGLRAVVAMTLGALALAVGAPAAYHLRNGVVEGDDYTGLLCLVAGAVLLLVGPVILWRSRRTDGSRRSRVVRRSLLAVAALVVAATIGWFVVFPIGLAYVYTHTAPVPDEPDLGVPYEDVTVPTSDGLELAATYVPSHNRAAVILFPGGGSAAEARMLVRHGFGVLLLDPRGQGGSEGDTVRWAGDRDLLAGAAYLRRRPDVDPDRIGGLGFSVGGELLLRAAASSQAIRAVVSEGAGERVGEATVSGVARLLVDPSQAVMTAATTVLSNHRPPPPIVDDIGDISPRPVLLIYADPGIGGESTRQPEYFAAAGDPKSIWMVPGSRHTGGLDAAPEDYERRVVGFLRAALLDNQPETKGAQP